MLPDIGVMIGAYIVVRMVSFLSRKDEREESVVVKLLAGLAILLTLICIYDLVSRGSAPTPVPSF